MAMLTAEAAESRMSAKSAVDACSVDQFAVPAMTSAIGDVLVLTVAVPPEAGNALTVSGSGGPRMMISHGCGVDQALLVVLITRQFLVCDCHLVSLVRCDVVTRAANRQRCVGAEVSR